MVLDHLISILLAAGFLAVIVVTILHGNYVKSESEKRERQLLLALAHDIRTPLTVIRGYTEGIMDGVADTDEKREAYLKQIKSKTIEMEQLLSDMMLYARATSGGIAYDMRPVRISEMLYSFTDEAKGDLSFRGAGLTLLDHTDGDISIEADAAQLKRVLSNIIENSIKYKRGDTVNILMELFASDSELMLEISDDGKGIRAPELPYIFDNMYRGSERDSGISGSGIGLWLVKRVVTDHGGRVYARSEYGSGTTIGMAMRLP